MARAPLQLAHDIGRSAADFLCLDTDPFAADIGKIKDIKVPKTFVGGKERFAA